MSTQYVGSVQYAAVAQWAASHTYAAGAIVRQLAAPAAGNERCFRTALGGVSAASEPTWVLTAGAASPTDGTVTDWVEVTGNATYAWNAAHARQRNALATGWLAAGDILYLASDNNETEASVVVTLSYPGTFASPNKVLCVNPAGSVPPVSADLRTTGQVNTTGTSSITLQGIAYIYGIKHNAGNGSAAANINIGGTSPSSIFLESCLLNLNTTGTANIFIGGQATSSQGMHVLKNCTANFGAVGQGFRGIGGGAWGQVINLTLTGAVSTTLFAPTSNMMTRVSCSDLSALGSGKNLVGPLASGAYIILERCKLGASVVVETTPTNNNSGVDLINCDSGTKNYRNERYRYQGTLTTETVNVLSGGASDGVTPFSHKIATTANDNAQFPFESFPMGEFYANNTNVSISQVFELLTDNVVLTNNDAWVEIEYLGSSATPQGTLISSAPADPLAAATNLATSTATWNTTGLGTPKPQKITMIWTPQMKGLYRAVLKVAKPSTTVWLNPPATQAA